MNLSLRVVGRRDDGYHLLESLMVKLNLADRLTIKKSESGLKMSAPGANLPEDEGNLVYRAAEAFFKLSGVNGGADIVLEKKIPVAAGLGGGSSDAAATLAGLNRLYGGPLPAEKLLEAGLRLGADVPFFLYEENSAFAEGIGEVLSPGPVLNDQKYLLLNPGWPLSTAEVFKKVRIELTTMRRKIKLSALNESSFTIDRDLYNDLEKVVIPQYEEVGIMKERLIACGAEAALMTGSGPTVFGIFSDSATRDEAERRLNLNKRDGWLVLSACAL